MNQAKLSSKFQLSIPKSVREAMHLQAGQKFTVVTRGDIIELIPMRAIGDARGMLASDSYDISDYRDRAERKL